MNGTEQQHNTSIVKTWPCGCKLAQLDERAHTFYCENHGPASYPSDQVQAAPSGNSAGDDRRHGAA